MFVVCRANVKVVDFSNTKVSEKSNEPVVILADLIGAMAIVG